MLIRRLATYSTYGNADPVIWLGRGIRMTTFSAGLELDEATELTYLIEFLSRTASASHLCVLLMTQLYKLESRPLSLVVSAQW